MVLTPLVVVDDTITLGEVTDAVVNVPESKALTKFRVVGNPVEELPSEETNKGCRLDGKDGGNEKR